MSPGAGDRRIVGGCELLSPLGRGASGQVFLSRRTSDGELVAVKLLHDADPDAVERFRREVEVLSRLRHPSILGVLAHGTFQGRPYLVLKYCPGATLRQHLEARGRLPVTDAARLVLQLAQALDHAHAHGVVHRDVKPANVILDARSRRARLIDFGVAHDVAGPRLTRTGDLLGTPLYMAPEQLRGQRGADPRVDVYALGALFYECATGAPPYTARTAVELAHKHAAGPPTPPTALVPGLPRPLDRICLAALEADPSRRTASARELAAALEGLLASPDAPDCEADGGASPRRARRPLLAAAAGVAALALAGWGLASRHARRQEPLDPGEVVGVLEAPPPAPSPPPSPHERAPAHAADERGAALERLLARALPLDGLEPDPAARRAFPDAARRLAQELPGDPRAARLRAIARLLEGGDELEARAELARLASATPVAGELVQHWLGRLCFALGFERAAYDALVPAAEARDASAAVRLSALLLLLKAAPPVRDPALALTFADALLDPPSTHPPRFLVHGLRGDVLLALERREEAATAYEEARRLVPRPDLAAHFELKARLARSGELPREEAGRRVPLVLPIGRRTRLLARLDDDGWPGGVAERAGRLAGEAAERGDPDGAALLWLRAAAAERGPGEAERRREALERGLAAAAAPDIRALLGRALARALLEPGAGRAEAGRVEGLVSVDEALVTPGERAEALLLLARARASQGLLDEAQRLLERAGAVGARDGRELAAAQALLSSPR
ncbi:MAG: serine/threonine protein kinase [Planctomycetes bacterium]|nr:serine/threonine protein kinase [Planctomycetota bacterium]